MKKCNGTGLVLKICETKNNVWKKYRLSIQNSIDNHIKITYIKPNFASLNNANFASQCLWTGGINMTSNWYCMPCIQEIGFAYTKSWTTVVEQRKYVKKYFSNKSFKIVKKVTKQQMKNYINRFHPKVGDMIYFYSSKKKRYSHTAIISSVTADKINYAAHSDSRFNKDLREPLQGDYYDHVEICHIEERGSLYE